MVSPIEQMFDLGGEIKCQIGKLFVHRLNDTERMFGAVEEIRIAKRDMGRATGNLLADLGTISAIKLWLEPFKFIGIALLLTGIGLALATIVKVLRWQSMRLWEMLS